METTSDTSLGRLLFERKATRAARVRNWLIAAALAVLGIVAGRTLSEQGYEFGSLFIAVLFWVAAGVAALLTFGEFRVYEDGIVQKRIKTEHRLRYLDMVGLRFSLTRMPNSDPSDLLLSMDFVPLPGGERIGHAEQVEGGDAQLEALRDRVAEMIAHSMRVRFRQGHDIAWAPTARFTPHGLLVHETKFAGSSEARLVPYTARMRQTLRDGLLRLFVGDEDKAAVTLECTEYNFYPGLRLLDLLRTQAVQQLPAAR